MKADGIELKFNEESGFGNGVEVHADDVHILTVQHSNYGEHVLFSIEYFTAGADEYLATFEPVEFYDWFQRLEIVRDSNGIPVIEPGMLKQLREIRDDSGHDSDD